MNPLQRQLNIETLRSKSRPELIDIYKKLVLPLPQRRPKIVSADPQSVNNSILKRKGDAVDDNGGAVKVVRRGINDLKIEQLKRPSSLDDDPMDGSNCKRRQITWP